MMLKKIESNLNRTESCGDCTVENEKALRWFCYVVAVVKGWGRPGSSSMFRSSSL
jgi:hypothetical protein